MLKKIFTNDKFFLTSVIISGLAAIVSFVLFLLSGINVVDFGLSKLVPSNVLVPLCVIGLYMSYQAHNKNIMKYLIGILMAIAAFVDLYNLDGYIASTPDSGSYAVIIYSLLTVFDFVLIINHIILNADHGSHPVNVRINQISIFIIAALNAVNFIVFVNNSKYSASPEFQIGLISTMLTYLFAYSSIVCIESRLDLYKAMRERQPD